MNLSWQGAPNDFVPRTSPWVQQQLGPSDNITVGLTCGKGAGNDNYNHTIASIHQSPPINSGYLEVVIKRREFFRPRFRDVRHTSTLHWGTHAHYVDMHPIIDFYSGGAYAATDTSIRDLFGDCRSSPKKIYNKSPEYS